jgi:PPM family protein phosphatase
MKDEAEVDFTEQLADPKDRKPPEAFSSLVQVDVYGLSHPGLVRPNNEDHFLVVRGGRTLEPVLGNLSSELMSECFEEIFYGMVVADGLGGHAAGEVASSQAIHSLLSMALHTPDWILRPGKNETNEVMWRMADRFIRVNAVLLQEAAAHANLDGMSTTMTATVSMGRDLIVTHVGDSRAYLVRKGKISRLTRDHTLAQRLLDEGAHAPNDHLVRELRNVLMQALGAKEASCRPDVHHLMLEHGDQVLLCTDGLSDMVDDTVIEAVLNHETAAREACQSLVDLALSNGGADNITVVVACYSIPSVPAN